MTMRFEAEACPHARRIPGDDIIVCLDCQSVTTDGVTWRAPGPNGPVLSVSLPANANPNPTAEHEAGEHPATGVLGCLFCLSRLATAAQDARARIEGYDADLELALNKLLRAEPMAAHFMQLHSEGKIAHEVPCQGWSPHGERDRWCPHLEVLNRFTGTGS